MAPRPLLGSPTRGLVKPASPLQPGQERGPCARVGDLLCHHSMPASAAGLLGLPALFPFPAVTLPLLLLEFGAACVAFGRFEGGVDLWPLSQQTAELRRGLGVQQWGGAGSPLLPQGLEF